MKQNTILFIAPNNSSFIRQDVEILQNHFKIKRFEFGSRKGIQMILRQLSLLWWLLCHIWTAKGLYIWFADYHSFLPTMFARTIGRKSFLVIGGYEAAKLRKYDYGGQVKRFRRWVIRKSSDWATNLLPVSRFIHSELHKHNESLNHQKCTVIHNGIDLKVFEGIATNGALRSGIICVSIADNVNRLKIKGLDYLMEVAAILPEETFCIVGITGEARKELESRQLPNVTILGKVDREALGKLFLGANVVCQFSRFESFGMALAEGMLCGCVPAILAGTGTSELVDETCGFVARTDEIQNIKNCIRNALSANDSFALNAQKRIRDKFSLERREEGLLRLFKECKVAEG